MVSDRIALSDPIAILSHITKKTKSHPEIRMAFAMYIHLLIALPAFVMGMQQFVCFVTVGFSEKLLI